MDTTMKVPILTAYFSYSGRYLHMNEDTIALPLPLDTVQRPMKAQRMVWGRAKAEWEKIFWQYDIAKNTQIERPKILKNPGQLNRVSFDGYDCNSFGRVVKIVQFFAKSSKEYLSNQALVTYYYDNKELCSFQIYTKLKHTLTEIEQFERSIYATAILHRAFMGWYLAGNSMFENPFGFNRRGKPLDYFRAYRLAYTFDERLEADKVYRNYEDCFDYENEHDIYDDISDSLFYEMYKKDMDDDIEDDMDDDIEDDMDDDIEDDMDDDLLYDLLYDPFYDPTDDTDDADEIMDWIEKQVKILFH